MKDIRPTILLTGATDGIGLALARVYHQRGARLILTGRRRRADLEPRLFQSDSYCRVDLSQPFAAPLVAEFLRRRGIERLDLLIHCAGVGSYGPVEQQSNAGIDQLLDTNLRAPIALTHTLLPLLASASGTVVFIGSVSAALPAPDYAVYGATKAALEGFARNLRIEQRGRVGVQVIHPGATRTAMHAKSGVPPERINWRRFPPPERVARGIAAVIDQGAPLTTIGGVNRILRFAGRRFGGIVDLIAGFAPRD